MASEPDTGPFASHGDRADFSNQLHLRCQAMTDDAVTRQIAAMQQMSTSDLRKEWKRHYHAEPPPRFSRDLLVRGVAWKIQERAHGGLSPATKRRLRALADQLAAGNDMAGTPALALKAGARLVREWRGQVHTVTVVADGFEYDGQRWRSLSQIAKAITGVHWSGPRFFGLAGSNGKGADRMRPGADAGCGDER